MDMDRGLRWLRWSQWGRDVLLLLAVVIGLALIFGVPILPGLQGASLPVLWLGLMVLAGALQLWRRALREWVVREARLPKFLHSKLRERWPHLTAKDCELVERGLRQFFLGFLRSRGKPVAMPSRVVDAMWHEFILSTRSYQQWCSAAFGRFLHHTPAEAMGENASRNDSLRRAWFWACRDEAIDPLQPTRLPLLFALDAKLSIDGGFYYQPDCSDIHRKSAAGGDSGQTYCATSFSDGSHSGDGSGFGGADGSGGGDGGDGGGGGD